MCDWKHCMRYGFLCCELTPVCEVWEMSFHSLLKYTHSQISIHTLLPAQTFANIPFNYAYLDHWQEVYTYCILFIDVQTWDTWGILTRTQICHRKQTNKRSSTKSSVFLIQRPPNILIHSESSSNCGSTQLNQKWKQRRLGPHWVSPRQRLSSISLFLQRDGGSVTSWDPLPSIREILRYPLIFYLFFNILDFHSFSAQS